MITGISAPPIGMANKIPSKRDNTIRRINAYCSLIQSKPKRISAKKIPEQN